MKQVIQTEDILKNIQAKERYIIFGYASMCKTCDISETMLQVVTEMRGIDYERLNLNYHKDLIELFKIRSAPALLLFKNGKLFREIYAFQSVPYLNEIFDQFLVD
ncbi:hypothetical protein JEODO184_01854 [Jeotgalicoccus meleagridis]|uniref:Thioredoxin domain-containing protein n=2 Tax=Jeotgalicoccus meleagridis TaxID=2759181 RepID=A0A6V7RQY2_9STAP|nr:hypothetical protein JEODO184_01854 [Jeotgalicoccus meleagridis]